MKVILENTDMKEDAAKTMSNSKLLRVMEGDWFEYVSPEGRKFYKNAKTQEVNWKPPRKMKLKEIEKNETAPSWPQSIVPQDNVGGILLKGSLRIAQPKKNKKKWHKCIAYLTNFFFIYRGKHSRSFEGNIPLIAAAIRKENIKKEIYCLTSLKSIVLFKSKKSLDGEAWFYHLAFVIDNLKDQSLKNDRLNGEILKNNLKVFFNDLYFNDLTRFGFEKLAISHTQNRNQNNSNQKQNLKRIPETFAKEIPQKTSDLQMQNSSLANQKEVITFQVRKETSLERIPEESTDSKSEIRKCSSETQLLGTDIILHRKDKNLCENNCLVKVHPQQITLKIANSEEEEKERVTEIQSQRTAYTESASSSLQEENNKQTFWRQVSFRLPTPPGWLARFDDKNYRYLYENQTTKELWGAARKEDNVVCFYDINTKRTSWLLPTINPQVETFL